MRPQPLDKRSRRARRRGHRGNVAIITAIAIVMLCGFAAVAVDVGNMYRVRSQERNALDAAALAGAGQLDGTSAGLDRARAAAIAQGRLHRVNRTNLELTNANILLGHWETGFTEVAAESDVDRINAVRIIYTTEPIRHPFGAVLGRQPSVVGARATAIGGGPINAPCAFPLVVPDCAMNPATTGSNCGYCMQMQDANTDTAGWTVFGGGAVNPPNIRNDIATACATVTPEGECGPRCANNTTQNQSISLGNGNMMNTGNNNFCPLIQDILQRNGAPESFKVTVPVLRTGQTGTCNPSFSGTGQVAGFAELTIFGARCSNGGVEVRAPNPSPSMPCNPPSGKYLLATLDCRTRINAPAGDGPFWGVTGRPRLVQ